jgi:hypothetical protein
MASAPNGFASSTMRLVARACLKNAFRQMYSTLSGRFVPNEGVVAGYVDRIWYKYHAKWGMQMAEMIFQTEAVKNLVSMKFRLS